MDGSIHIYTCNIMAISLKEQLKLVKEITYHSPVFDKDYYENSDLHGAGQRAGTRMFYDFYAMELLWSQVGSGSRPKADRQKAKMMDPDDPSADIVGSKNQPVRHILRTKELHIIDDLYEQVTRTIAKHLINYVHLAVVQEFQYLISQSVGWSKFRQSIVASYNKNKTMTKQEFQRLCKKYIPEMEPYPDTVKRLLKYSKYYSEMHTHDDKDPFDVTRAVAGSEKIPHIEPEPEPEAEPTPDTGEPDTTDYSAEPIDDPYHNPEDEPSTYTPKPDPTYSDEDDYWKKKKELDEAQYLKEEKINPSKIKKVYAAMQKAGVTLDDVEKAYNYIEWGGAYGGPKWGAGALAMLKLMKAKKTEDPEDLAHIIDHIYDLQHNTGSLLNKGPMYVSDEDLNRRFRVTHIARFIPFVSPMIKAIILRYLKYVHGDPSLEAQKEHIINQPAEQLSPEEKQKLTAEGFQQKGQIFRISVNFVNKKKESVSGVYYEVGKHGGKYTVNDNFKSDVQVYDTFDEAFNYVMNHKQDFLKHGYSMHSPPASQSEKNQYINSHTKVKLAPDREKQLLDICKMGWRAKPDSQYYKAYFPGNKRFQMYAFSDGSYLCTFNDTEAYKVFNDWDNAFNYCKTATDNALPYPDPAAAQAAMTGATVTSPSSAPSPSPKEYYLEPLETSVLQTLVASSLPQTVTTQHVVSEKPNGMVSVNKQQVGQFIPLFSVGKKMNSTFGKPYKVIHYIGHGGVEDWSFKKWNDVIDFVGNNIEKLTIPQSLSSQTVYPKSTTAAIYGSLQLPDNATSKAAYSVHSGLNFPPKNSIRLTVEDENALKAIGFQPKLVGQDVWYIHTPSNDTVKFYPNNEAKILFTGKTKSPVVKKTIEDMLAWLPTHYSTSTKQSPLTAPTPVAAPQQGGVKAGAMFEGIITGAGFYWDDIAKHYTDGPGAGYTIVINPYPKSTLTQWDENGNSTVIKTFSTLPALAAFLKTEFPELKKKVSTVSKAEPTTEHDGITPDEAGKIELFIAEKHEGKYWTQYVSAAPDQSAYVEIFRYNPNANIGEIFASVGALGNYYQINDSNNKPVHNASTLQNIMDKLDIMINNYEATKQTSQGQTIDQNLTDEEFKLIKDLTAKWPNQYSVKRKKMISKVMGEIPYIAISKKKGDKPLYTIGKTANKGHYVIYQVIDQTWSTILETDSFGTIYDKLNSLLEAMSQEKSPVLTNDQKDWIETFITNTKPNLTVKKWHDGSVGVYDEHKKQNPLDPHDAGNPMFICSKTKSTPFTIRYFTEDWGAQYSYHSTDTFEEMAEYIQANIDMLTSLATPSIPEGSYNIKGDLVNALYDGKFVFKGKSLTESNGNVYENPEGTRVFIYDNGTASVYQKNNPDYIPFNTHEELLKWLTDTYSKKDEKEVEEDTGVDPGKWSPIKGDTGDSELDSLLKDADFKYQGTSAGDPLAMNFFTQGGAKLKIYDDGSSSHTWAPESSYDPTPKSVGFNDYPSLKDFLKNVYAAKKTGGFPGKAHLEKAWESLWNKLQDYGFILQGGGTEGIYKTKSYKHPNGATLLVYDDGHSTYKDPSDIPTYNFGSFEAAEEYISKKFDPAIYTKLPTHYYQDLGAYEKAYSIQLTEDDDFQMRQLGWVFVSSSESQQQNAYVHKITGKKIVFYNKALMPNKQTATKTDEKWIPLLQFTNETIPQVIDFLKLHPEKMSDKKPVGGNYTTDYYQDVGPDKNHVTIRLKKEHDQILEDYGFMWLPIQGSMPFSYKHCVTGEILNFYNIPIATESQPAAKLMNPAGSVAVRVFTTIPEALSFVIGGYKKLTGGFYTVSYYTIVGPQPHASTIRLTYNDEKKLTAANFKWVPAWVSGKPSAYVNVVADRRVEFYNMQKTSVGPAAQLQDYAGAPKKTYSSLTMALYEISKLDPHKKDVTKSKSAESILTKEEAGPIMVHELTLGNWQTPPHSYDDVKFTVTNTGNYGGEIQVTHVDKVKFAIGKTPSSMTDAGFMWYVRHVTTQGERIYSFMKKPAMMTFVQTHLQNLLTYTPLPSLWEEKGNKTPPFQLQGPASHLSNHLSKLADAAGFHTEMNSLGVMYEHENHFYFQVFQNGIAWSCPKIGSKEWMLPKEHHEKFLGKVLSQVGNEMMSEDLDKIFSAAMATRQEKAFDRVLRICRRLGGVNMGGTYFDESMEATGFTWNDLDKCYMNEEIFQAVVVMPGFGGNKYRIYWVNRKGDVSHGQTNSDKVLAATIGPKGSIVKSGDCGALEMQTPSQSQQPGWKAIDYLTPSGESYKVHDNEANSSYIKLNEHDEQILLKAGFQWVPQENHYYKHIKTGDIATFSDTGKATVWNQSEGTTPFDSVIHALKFIVLKYIQSPWTAQDYDQKPSDENVSEIQLNEHDHSLMETLGFKWDGKKKYVKKVNESDTPALEEAKKKKKKEDPSQGQLPLEPGTPGYLHPDNDEDEEESSYPRYEIVTCYNTGNAIWDEVYDYHNNTDEPINTEEGPILLILNFVWNRWKHDIEKSAGVPTIAKKQIKGLLSKHNYNTIDQDKVQKVVALHPDDAQALAEVGFTFSEDFGYPLYIRGEDENFAAYNDNTAHYSGPLANQQQGDLYFKSVVEGLQFLLNAKPPVETNKVIVPKEEITDKLETLGFVQNDKQEFVLADIDANKQKIVFYSNGQVVYSYYDLGLEKHQSFTHKNFDTLYPYLKQAIDEQNHLLSQPDAFSYGKRAPEITHKLLVSTVAFRWDVDVKAYVKNWDDPEKWQAVVYGYDGDKYIYFRPVKDSGVTYHKPFKSTNPQAVLNAIKMVQLNETDEALEKLGYQKLTQPITGVVYGTNVLTEYYKHQTKESILVTSHDTWYGFYSPKPGSVSTDLVWSPYQKFHSALDVATYLSAEGHKAPPQKPLPDTSEMVPYSGIDYANLTTKTMGLKPSSTIFLSGMDHETMEEMGFHSQTTGTAPSRRYVKGKEMVAFYGNGTAKYWPNYKEAKNTPFSTVKSAMEFLWAKHKKPKSEMPASGADYKSWHETNMPDAPKDMSIEMNLIDTELLEKIGFHKQVGTSAQASHSGKSNDQIYYQKGDTNDPNKETVQFLANGKANYWDTRLGPKAFKKFESIKDALQFLWNKHKPTIKESFYKNYMTQYLE